MKITRNVNGTDMEFELTDTELTDAYYETRLAWDKEAIIELLDACEATDKLARLMNDAELLSAVAWIFRDKLDMYITGDDELCAFDSAYRICTEGSGVYRICTEGE